MNISNKSNKSKLYAGFLTELKSGPTNTFEMIPLNLSLKRIAKNKTKIGIYIRGKSFGYCLHFHKIVTYFVKSCLIRLNLCMVVKTFNRPQRRYHNFPSSNSFQ